MARMFSFAISMTATLLAMASNQTLGDERLEGLETFSGEYPLLLADEWDRKFNKCIAAAEQKYKQCSDARLPDCGREYSKDYEWCKQFASGR